MPDINEDQAVAIQENEDSTFVYEEKLRKVSKLVSKILDKYHGDKDMLIQILLELQNEYGWLPQEMLREIEKQLGVPIASLYQIASFYKAFSLAPKGRHVIRVCVGFACHVRGAPLILNILQQHCNIGPGDTTQDMRFTLETVSCLGCCPIAPVVVIDDNYHGRVKLTEIKDILDTYE